MRPISSPSQPVKSPVDPHVSAGEPIERWGEMPYTEVGQDVSPAVETDTESNKCSKRACVTVGQLASCDVSSYSLLKKFSIFWADSWITEVLCCVSAIIALLCLISALRYFDGFVLTELPLHLSINTLVAVLAAVIKASILLPVTECISQLKWQWFTDSRRLVDFEKFDLASRGPLGSLLLVFHLRSRNLAAFGAWVTVLALAIDPFTQQIIRPVSCRTVLVGAMARITRTNNSTIDNNSPESNFEALDPEMSKAIQVGLLNGPIVTGYECSTGNCTFPSTAGPKANLQTLAMQSSCVDITNETRLVDNSTTYYIPRLGYNKTAFRPDILLRIITNENSGLEFPEYWLAGAKESTFYSFSIVALTMDWARWDGIVGKGPYSMQPFAAECRLWPSVQKIISSIEQSSLQEFLVSAEPLTRFNTTNPFSHLSISKKTLRNGTWQLCAHSSTYSSETPVPVLNNMLWLNDSSPDIPNNLHWYPEDCIWTVDDKFSIRLLTFLQDLMKEKELLLTFGLKNYKAFNGDLWINDLWQYGTADLRSVEAFIARISRAITAVMRLQGSRKSERFGFVKGEALQTKTCVQVQWGWVAFPASLVAMTLTFLAMTVWEVRRIQAKSGQGTWKSSSLAILFGGLDESIRQKYGLMAKKSEMLTCAEDLEVSLRPQQSGWRFIEGNQNCTSPGDLKD